MRPSVRDELVSKALDAFYSKGFHVTGMDRLAEETGISKTTMYNHFRTKEDLIAATLQLRHERFRDWLVRRVESAADDPRDRLLAIFDALGEWFRAPDFCGCMFMKAAAEYPAMAHPIHLQATEHKQDLADFVAGIARQAGAQGPDALARRLVLLMEGAIVTTHIGRTGDHAEDAKVAAGVLIDDAFPSA